ncbi:peroxidase 20 [Artemisia annua]|uniref:Basic peroxidase n=1 Tax=Artemisia annua TaxID=35608 RepID=A0A2U1PLF8_ARTAN|nr:peroxidase 20 [Artemisia annua]
MLGWVVFRLVESCNKGFYKGLSLADSGLNVSLLQFADDALFFGGWSRLNAKNLIHILKCFELASGLKVNITKSRLMGVGVSNVDIAVVASSLGCTHDSLPFTYPGLPVGRKMRGCKSWTEVINRFRERLSSWKAKSLLAGCRLTLIKSILGSLPMYYLSLFKAPAKDSNRGISWVKWKSILLDKDIGGLGVECLQAKNLGLLGKWKWRFLTEDKALWRIVIKEFYGEDGGFNSSLNRIASGALVVLSQTRPSLCYNEPLVLGYYEETCQLLEKIVRRQVAIAVYKEPRMAASLLRLHFHDCFVMGCDASVLLDDFEGVQSEKNAGPNLNSLRGFEVIDEIKYLVEEACPCTVSCADLLAIVARDAVALRGGPKWNVYLGRKDSMKASLDGANQLIPAPNSSLETLIANFRYQGSHTIGKAQCKSFRQRIYDYDDSEKNSYHHHRNDNEFQRVLKSICPKSGKDNALAPLDIATPLRFDNHYFQNIKQGLGLLISDNVLISEDIEGEIRDLVWEFASDEKKFFGMFADSLIKMGNIRVLTGQQGEIRKNCRFINT